ncbi:PREDICTED: uncharacterized protein LOC108446508, partial [Corvus brachyrhynchos]|uniref:uncharacterized protein LOC108446508 n=1 Tax=Corvus brachyrhynchos TaxID=85066 RepID=UPI00081667EC
MRPRIPEFPNSRIPKFPDSRIPKFPDSQTPEFPDSRTPRLPNSWIPNFPNSRIPKFPDSRIPEFPNSRTPELPSSRIPGFPESFSRFQDPELPGKRRKFRIPRVPLTQIIWKKGKTAPLPSSRIPGFPESFSRFQDPELPGKRRKFRIPRERGFFGKEEFLARPNPWKKGIFGTRGIPRRKQFPGSETRGGEKKNPRTSRKRRENPDFFGKGESGEGRRCRQNSRGFFSRRIFIIWAISSWFRRGPAPQEPNSPGGSPRSPSRNLFPKDTLMDLYVYVSEHEHFTDFNVSSALFWEKRDLVYGDWSSGENSDGCYEHFGELDVSQSVQRNGSIYVHVYFTKSGFHPDTRQKSLYRRLATVHTSRSTEFPGIPDFPAPNPSGTAPFPPGNRRAEDFGPVEVISHWHPNLTINMVDDHTPWVALLETNPYLLALTIVVSIVHSVFEFLAFKN